MKKIHEKMEVLSRELLMNDFFKVYKDTLKLPNDDTYPYLVLEPAPIAIMVLPKTEQGNYILNHEYRHPTKQYLLSCPGGIKLENETETEGAIRELLEETGYRAKHFEKIGEAYPFPGIARQKCVFFRAEGAIKQQEPNLETAEILETQIFTPNQLKIRIQEGHLLDGLLCTALFFDQLNK